MSGPQPPSLPPEPFAYMSRSTAQLKVRSPIALILTSLLIVVAFCGIGFYTLGKHSSRHGAVPAAIVILGIGLGLGGFGLYAGTRRLLWRNTYIRTTGQKPW